MKYLFPILFLFILSCDNNNNDSTDSTCIGNNIYSNIKGITFTDEKGKTLSDQDDNDWQCCIGNELPKRSGDVTDDGAHIPYAITISPAYPNPSDGSITIDFSNEVSTELSIHIIDNEGNTVDMLLLDEFISAGNYEYKWNLNIDDGIYRIIFESEDEKGFYCYGDVCICSNYQNCNSICDY